MPLKIVVYNFTVQNFIAEYFFSISILKLVLALARFTLLFIWSFTVSNHMCLNPFKNFFVYFPCHMDMNSCKWKIQKLFGIWIIWITWPISIIYGYDFLSIVSGYPNGTTRISKYWS